MDQFRLFVSLPFLQHQYSMVLVQIEKAESDYQYKSHKVLTEFEYSKAFRKYQTSASLFSNFHFNGIYKTEFFIVNEQAVEAMAQEVIKKINYDNELKRFVVEFAIVKLEDLANPVLPKTDYHLDIFICVSDDFNKGRWKESSAKVELFAADLNLKTV